MAVVRRYDPLTGAVLSEFNATAIANGTIDSLGNGEFVTSTLLSVQHIAIEPSGLGRLLRTLLTFPANEHGIGVVIQRRHLPDGSLDPEGPMLHVGVNTVPGGLFTYTVRNYDLETMTLLSEVSPELVPQAASFGGLATDGVRIFLSFENFTPAPRMDLIEPDGTALAIVRQWAWPAVALDLTFDGSHLWTIEGGTAVVQYSLRDGAAPVAVGGFAISSGNGAGICHDGQNLVVLSRT